MREGRIVYIGYTYSASRADELWPCLFCPCFRDLLCQEERPAQHYRLFLRSHYAFPFGRHSSPGHGGQGIYPGPSGRIFGISRLDPRKGTYEFLWQVRDYPDSGGSAPDIGLSHRSGPHPGGDRGPHCQAKKSRAPSRDKGDAGKERGRTAAETSGKKSRCSGGLRILQGDRAV